MDKVKLFSTNKNSINKSIIDNNFKCIGSDYDILKHNTKLTYCNDLTIILMDKFGVHVKANPTRYLKGNNINQIDKKGLSEFIERFENDLHINTDNFQLAGFDFNINVITDYPPKSYLTTIRTLPKYKQMTSPYIEGISFMNNCKSFIFYDKIKELNRSNVIIPDEYNDLNLLRLELSVKGKMKQTKNLSKINTLQDLTLSDNYISAVNEFENIYDKIHKQPIFRFNDMKTPSPLVINTNDFALLFYINEIGMDEYLNQLKQEKDMNLLSYHQWKLRKDKALNLWDIYSSTDTNTIDLLTEMNSKVKKRINEIKELAIAA